MNYDNLAHRCVLFLTCNDSDGDNLMVKKDKQVILMIMFACTGFVVTCINMGNSKQEMQVVR